MRVRSYFTSSPCIRILASWIERCFAVAAFVMTSVHFTPDDSRAQVGQTDTESIGLKEVNNRHLVLPRESYSVYYLFIFYGKGREFCEVSGPRHEPTK